VEVDGVTAVPPVPVEVLLGAVVVAVVSVVDVVEVVCAGGRPEPLLGTVRSGVDLGTESM
jgi:hypothetical protein